MNIDQFKSFCELITNKNQSGNTIPPAKFNLAVWRAVMGFIEAEYVKYKSTQIVSDALDIILVHVPTPVPANGQMTYPVNWLHTSSARTYVPQQSGGFKEYPIEIIENRDLGDVLKSDLEPATPDFPNMVHFTNYIQFYPYNIGSVMFDYFRTPKQPVWAYTLVNTRPVYDAVNSVDMEFPDDYQNTIAFRTLQYLGFNIREVDVVQFAMTQKAVENQ